MASALRDGWKKFKSKYPEFEKSKSFKADLGPNLDEFAKNQDSAQKHLKKALDDVNDMIESLKNVNNISKSYEAVIDALNDDAAAKAWDKFQKELADMGKTIRGLSTDVKNMAMNFD